LVVVGCRLFASTGRMTGTASGRADALFMSAPSFLDLKMAAL